MFSRSGILGAIVAVKKSTITLSQSVVGSCLIGQGSESLVLEYADASLVSLGVQALFDPQATAKPYFLPNKSSNLPEVHYSFDCEFTME